MSVPRIGTTVAFVIWMVMLITMSLVALCGYRVLPGDYVFVWQSLRSELGGSDRIVYFPMHLLYFEPYAISSFLFCLGMFSCCLSVVVRKLSVQFTVVAVVAYTCLWVCWQCYALRHTGFDALVVTIALLGLVPQVACFAASIALCCICRARTVCPENPIP